VRVHKTFHFHVIVEVAVISEVWWCKNHPLQWGSIGDFRSLEWFWNPT
jgi:hypothetical protein